MKKIIALVLIMMVMGTTYAETCDITQVLKKNVANPELAELQAKADELFKDSHVAFDVKAIETKGISSGEAKYNVTANEENRSWFENAIDWITFWN